MRIILSGILFFLVNISFSQEKLKLLDISLEQAIQLANAQNKLIFIDAYADYCIPCKKLDKEMKNPAVVSFFNKHFINIKVNMEGPNGPQYKNEFQIVFLPTLMFLDKNGSEKVKIDNVLSANELLAYARHVNTKYSSKSKPFPNSESTDFLKNEKIISVLDNTSELPPELLKEEAYYRMQYMDGSHIKYAQKYLASQSDWNTDDNKRFLFDFLDNANSKEFKYLIENKVDFVNLLGEATVAQTINILVYKALERAFPKPDLERAKTLFGYIDPSSALLKAYEYRLDYLRGNSVNEYVALVSEIKASNDPELIALLNQN